MNNHKKCNKVQGITEACVHKLWYVASAIITEIKVYGACCNLCTTRRSVKKSTLQHNGILFPPVYEAKGLSISINGKKTALTPLQEEMAYLWSKKKDTPYAQDTVFQKNFTKDFSRHLGKAYSGIKYSDI